MGAEPVTILVQAPPKTALVFLKTKSLLLAGIIGSIAASCECEIDGNIPIETKSVLDKINQVEKIAKYK